MSVPNPGSREAVEQGCKCPVYDNWRGDPELGRIRGFIVVEGCPLHHKRPVQRGAGTPSEGEAGTAAVDPSDGLPANALEGNHSPERTKP